MIAKKSVMKNINKSSFKNLIAYLTTSQGSNQRIESVTVNNCLSNDYEMALFEVETTQEMNKRSKKDKTYHLILSFAPSENISQSQLAIIEEKVVASLGYVEHQRISVVHNDTDHLHIHVAINKIHPTTFNTYEPKSDFKTLGNICAQIEKEYGLVQTNHVTQIQKKVDFENKSGIESFITYIRNECLSDIDLTKNWKELHKILAAKNIEIKPKGNGLVFCDKGSGLQVKLSSVSRELSKAKLETRLGRFSFVVEDVTVEKVYKEKPLHSKTLSQDLFKQYEEEQSIFKINKHEQLKQVDLWRSEEINKLKTAYQFKASLLKFADSGIAKKLAYRMLRKEMNKEISVLKNLAYEQRRKIYKENKNLGWQAWLQSEGSKGNTQALNILRYKNSKIKKRFDNSVSGKNGKVGSISKYADYTSTTGTRHFNSGTQAIREDSQRLYLSDTPSYEAVETVLKLAIERYGNHLNIQGSESFKRKIVQIAVQRNLPLSFDDPNLDKLKHSMNERKQYEHNRRNKDRNRYDIKSAAGFITYVGSLERKGVIPPSDRRMRLLNMSELAVVSDKEKQFELLLSSDVPNYLERERGRDSDLRRHLYETGSIEPVAAYINERNEKRLRIKDIPEHIMYNNSYISEKMTFFGVRNVGDKHIALLKKEGDLKMYVLEINDYQKRRLKTVKRNSTVIVDKNGIKKGRTR